ncbi:hypothetical protein ACFQY0_10930 [Haloferula chungangensis]|uniref:FecR protein n=1 Tax=Haloferula chungangensis TaxID=1048331 RepID=A0ABW2L5Q1_9BACT
MTPEQLATQNQILQLLDGELDEESARLLDKELRTNGESRRLYIQLSTLHSALEEQESARSSTGRVPVVPVERLLESQRRRILSKALLATAAVLLLSAVVLWVKLVPASAPVASFRLAAESAYVLSHAEGEEAPEGHVLDTGSRLQLTEGVLEASFKSGVKCVIKAPCELAVLADDRVSIPEGVAWFHVPPQGVGFTVELPHLTVTDLGTEFGVSAPAKGDNEVHVMTGRVRVLQRDATHGPVELIAGEARLSGPGGALIEIPVRAERFMDALPQRPSRLISNGNLNVPVDQYEDNSGDTVFRLDPTTLRVLANGEDTEIQSNEWLWSSLTRGFQYSENGGTSGDSGAFIEGAPSHLLGYMRPRAVAQFSKDLKATQGSRTLRMEVLLDDNSRAGRLTLLVELLAWNSDQTGPELSMGGPHANEPTYHVTRLNDATALLHTEIPAVSIADNAWETIDLGTVDLADGYDFYAWRIGVVSATTKDRFAFDNLRIAY